MYIYLNVDRCSHIYGKRSTESMVIKEEERLVADLLLKQDVLQRNSRGRRAVPAIERNIFFVLDTSGSIGPINFQNVLNNIASFVEYFCGNVSIGLMTFGSTISLEFCPQCLRSGTLTDYNNLVQSRIRNTPYRDGNTATGAAIECLADLLLPSQDCRVLNKPTQLVFITDGRANICTPPQTAMQTLIRAFPTVEVYGIGLGDILESGITDLLYKTDPLNLFNVANMAELNDVFDYLRQYVNSGVLECAPVLVG